jgi:hypothetical protein
LRQLLRCCLFLLLLLNLPPLPPPILRACEAVDCEAELDHGGFAIVAIVFPRKPKSFRPRESKDIPAKQNEEDKELRRCEQNKRGGAAKYIYTTEGEYAISRKVRHKKSWLDS